MRRPWKLTLFSVALMVATIGWFWLLFQSCRTFAGALTTSAMTSFLNALLSAADEQNEPQLIF